MKTVLITGCSSGYGLATARHFHDQGWNVIATMRAPRADMLRSTARLRVMALDVTKPESIAAALAAAGPIDVLVNNAGIGLFGAFEATPMTTTREVFETNTFGVMAMTQAVLPQLRARRSGVIVNVTSSATLAPMPLVAVYTASKMAIEGFSASLAFELARLRCARQAGRARVRSRYALHAERCAAHGRVDSRSLCAAGAIDLRLTCARARRDHGIGCRRSGVGRSQRCLDPAQATRRAGRSGPGRSSGVNRGVERTLTVQRPLHACAFACARALDRPSEPR